ncbi:MAG: DUF2190 family protein [Planctomycetaceae bacterium]
MRYLHGNTLMVDCTPVADVTAGDVIVVGNECRVAHLDIEANQLGALAAPCGAAVYDVAKQGGAGVTFADGAAVYWDDANNRAVAADGGGANKRLGTAVLAAADADTSVRVRHHA